MSEMDSLMTEAIPRCLQALQESHTNLQRVADYCEKNYLSSDNKSAALDETKKFTTQSLASLAYQINTVAFNISQLVDLRSEHVEQTAGHVSQLSQQIEIHREKVARREIGMLTTNKMVARQYKILAPANHERPIRYERRPIDFSLLDGIGHGVVTDTAAKHLTGGGGGTGTLQRAGRHNSITSHSSVTSSGANSAASAAAAASSHYGAGPAPTTRPPTPPQLGYRVPGTMTRANKEYRALPVVQPVVPQAPTVGYGAGQGRVKSGVGDQLLAQPAAPGVPPPPPHVGPAQSMGQHELAVRTLSGCDGKRRSTDPATVGLSTLRMRAAPTSRELHFDQQLGSHHQHVQSLDSMPLPPPPADLDVSLGASEVSGDVVSAGARHHSWAPHNYIEKVIAIYDYRADKADELSFTENSVIYVVKKNDDGWWEGVLDGVTGLFPGNYVESLLH